MNKVPSTLFYWLFNATFYVFIAITVAITGFEVSRWFRNDYRTTYSIGSFRPTEMAYEVPKVTLTPLTNSVLTPALMPTEWRVTFDAADRSIKIMMTVVLFLQLLFVFVILWTLRSFVFSLKNKEAFSLLNIARLQRLGILLLLIEPLYWCSKYFFRSWLTEHVNIKIKSLSMPYQFGYSLGAREFIWNWFFAGLLVLTIAEVFKQGLKLKEEADLTV